MILLLIAFFRRKKLNFKKWIYAALIVFLVFSNPFIFKSFLMSWEGKNTNLQKEYDAVIILGGYSSWNERHQMVSFNESSDRFIEGLRLYKTGVAKSIVLSGGSGQFLKPEEKESAWAFEKLVELGVSEKDIILENESRNTHENAVNTSAMIDKTKNCLLITSAFHMNRASKCFEKEGLHCDLYRVDFLADDDDFTIDSYILPSAFVLSAWQLLIKEWLGYATYKMRGFI